jgi:hypothetical protein
MGALSSSEFKDTHILHYFKPLDNKLYVYVPRRDKFYSFSILNKSQKFRFYQQESIALSSGAIYLIGGQTISSNEDFRMSAVDRMPPNLGPTNFVTKINLKKHENFQIDIAKMKPCKLLPEVRSSHLLVHHDYYIYAIAGHVEKNVQTRTCHKFHIKKKVWERIADIGFSTSLTDLCGLSINGFIYAFDTAVKSDLPRIHRYSIELNSWIEILLNQRDNNLRIPPSVSCGAYQNKENEIIIFSGSNVQNKIKQYYYTYNLDSEELSPIILTENNSVPTKEKQANLNYTNSKNIYMRLNDRSVMLFKKTENKFAELELTAENAISNDFGCCSRKR